jgi:hypothetical protein
MGLKDVSIKEIVLKIIGYMSTSYSFDQFTQAAKSIASSAVDANEILKFCILMDYEERSTKSLFDYLCRFLKAPKTIFLDDYWKEWTRKIQSNEVSFFLRLPTQVSSNFPLFDIEREHNTTENNIFEIETFQRRRVTEFAYIIQVVLNILGLSSDSDTAFGKTIARYARRLCASDRFYIQEEEPPTSFNFCCYKRVSFVFSMSTSSRCCARRP